MTSYEKCLVTPNDLDNLVFFTIRYALGRMTGVVGTAQDYVEKYKEHLSTYTLEQIQREVANKITEKEGMMKTIGMNCDHESWVAFIKKISVILKERENENV